MSTPPNDNQPNGSTPQWGAPGQGAGHDAAANPYSPDPQGGSKFGTQAYDASAYGGSVQEPDKFRKLKLFLLVSLGIYALNQIMGFFVISGDAFRDEMVAQMEQTYAEMGVAFEASDIDGIIAFATGAAVVFGLIGLGLYLLVYFGLRSNKNWARIVGIVFAIIGAVGVLGAFLFNPVDMITLIITLVWIGVSIYWLVLAFSAEVAQYLQQFKRPI